MLDRSTAWGPIPPLAVPVPVPIKTDMAEKDKELKDLKTDVNNLKTQIAELDKQLEALTTVFR